MSIKQILTSNNLERMFASQQIESCVFAKQAAALDGDKHQYRHYIDCIDNIVSRYGANVLTQSELNE